MLKLRDVIHIIPTQQNSLPPEIGMVMSNVLVPWQHLSHAWALLGQGKLSQAKSMPGKIANN